MSTVHRSAGAAPGATRPARTADGEPPGDDPTPGWFLRDGRGLFLLALGFLAGAVLVWRLLPPVGPGVFPLSSLFLLLAFVALAGATVAYFLGRHDPFSAADPAPAPRAPARAPNPADYGRPRPEVRRAASSARLAASSGLGISLVAATVPPPPAPWVPTASAEPWSEDDRDAEIPPLEPPASRAPVIEDALAELDRIERDIGPRAGRLAADASARS